MNDGNDGNYRRLDGTVVHDGDVIVPGVPDRNVERVVGQPMLKVTDACESCGNELPHNECPVSKRPCGHHCDCSFDQDVCHWCGREFGEQTEDEALEPRRRAFITAYLDSSDPALKIAASRILQVSYVSTHGLGDSEIATAVRHIEKAWNRWVEELRAEDDPVASPAHRGRTLVSLTTTRSRQDQAEREFDASATMLSNCAAVESDPRDVEAVNAMLVRHRQFVVDGVVNPDGGATLDTARSLARGEIVIGHPTRGADLDLTDPIANARLAAKLYWEKARDHRLDLFRYPVDLGDPGMDDDDPVGSLEGPGRVPQGLDLTEVMRRAGVPLLTRRPRPDPAWARRREARDRREARRG